MLIWDLKIESPQLDTSRLTGLFVTEVNSMIVHVKTHMLTCCMVNLDNINETVSWAKYSA
jgi:hypothetical protein